jgi:hypothetical protein
VKRLTDEELNALCSYRNGFRGCFSFEPENEHCPDRIVYTSDDFGDEHVISDCIEPEVADPIVRLLNGAGVAASELIERRAADLTDEEREALTWLRGRVNRMVNDREAYTALAVLDRLLQGGKP